MNIWLIIGLIMAGVVFLLDYLLRRKKWNDNTKQEKISLVISMVSIVVYMFFSALGMLWGIVEYVPETAFGNVLYDVTLIMAGIYFIIAFVAVILTFILRKLGKAKASIWVNIIAFAYILVVFLVNFLAGVLL